MDPVNVPDSAAVERKLAEQAAALADQARFPEMNPGPVLRIQLDGRIVLANAAARNVFGDDLAGRQWHVVCPGIGDDVWARILVAEEPLYVEVEIGGRVFSFAHRRDPEGHLVFAYGADVTVQKEAERKLADQARMLAEFARFPEMNPGPVLRMTLDSSVILANAAARHVFGEAIVGRSWQDVCPGMDGELWNRILKAGDVVYVEAHIGESEYVFAHRHDTGGQLVFVFGADVTQQKLAERALRQTERMATLGTLAAGVAHELNNPAAAARRSAEQLREAFARLEAAHFQLDAAEIDAAGRELLRALDERAREHAGRPSGLDALTRSDRESEVEEWLDERSIEGGWELAPALVGMGLEPAELNRLEDALGAPAFAAAAGWAASAFAVYALLREIAEASSRVSELVGALKSYSYLGQAPVQEVDVHVGIDNTLLILGNKLKGGIEVTRDYCDDLPPVPAYGSELNQVWTNLIDNAADAMEGTGHITIRTRKDGTWAVVEIEDDGPGIPTAILPHVFDPFFTTKAPGKGTGLGLSTSYSIITEKHQGSLTVESRPGMTRFTARLPLAAPPNHAGQAGG